ncbi:Uncharacterised protein [Chlamydia abortus]|nr:Uncharacterised protein [Chlamydia abortus]
MEPIRDYTMYAAFSGCLSSVGSDGPKNRAIMELWIGLDPAPRC